MVFYPPMAVDRNTVTREAQKFASKGQFDKAIAEWRKLVKETPDDPNIFNTIGDLCLKKNAKTDAVEAYKRAADLLAADGFTSKAIALYKKVLNIDISRVDVHLALGDMHAEKGLTGNALENYKHVADHYNKLNKKSDALGIYQKMADLNPANVAFRVKLAGMYAKEGMKSEAVRAYLDAAEQHITKDEFQEARKMFERVLELDPENKAVYHKAGIVYYKEDKVDEARKSLKRAFEADPENEELMTLYLEVLEKAGRAGDAEDVYRKLLTQDPSRHDLLERIYQILLDKKEYDRALTEAVAIAQHRSASMDFSGAAETLKGLIAVTHDPLPAAAALADLFGKHGRAKDGARELVLAADALIERGSPDDAREVLNRALILSPGLDEAIEKLDGLGGAASAAAAGEAATLELGGEELIEELAPPTLEEPPLPAAAPKEREDPAVAAALTEVEVLIKYGLGPKAAEQLESIVQRFPDAPRVRVMLFDLYREQKKSDKAVIQALMLADLYERRGQKDESQNVLRSALDLAPGNPQIMAQLGMAPAEAEAIETIEEPEAIEEITDIPDIPDLAVPDLELETSADLEDIQVPEEPEDIVFEEEAPEEAPPARHAVRPHAPPPLEEQFEEESPVEQPAPRGEPLAESDVTELWAEAEFYYQQGLFDEARKCYERIIEYRPDDRKAMERLVELAREKEDVAEFSRLAEAVEGLEHLVEAGPTLEENVTASDVDSVKSLMQEITDLRKGKKEPPQAKKAGKPSKAKLEPEESFAGLNEDEGAAVPAAPAKAPDQADDAADFFDLAAELRDELSTDTASAAPSALHEQSIDEIFEEFKAGVEAHEKKEDEDTHYNLGVAYREMGLLDDAISEFNMTNEGEPKFILSRYMLGLCHLENGDFETAITEIQNALGYSYSFGEASEERIGMHYDLGLAYQGVGNTQGALEELQKVYNLDPTYREVATKIKELEEGEFISLESIKEDIEKEISFKFLEEGARIEREEKTKKTRK